MPDFFCRLQNDTVCLVYIVSIQMVTNIDSLPCIYGPSVATGSPEGLLDEADEEQHNIVQAAPIELKLGKGE